MRKFAIATNNWAIQNSNIFFENFRVLKLIEFKIITQIAHRNNPNEV